MKNDLFIKEQSVLCVIEIIFPIRLQDSLIINIAGNNQGHRFVT